MGLETNGNNKMVFTEKEFNRMGNITILIMIFFNIISFIIGFLVGRC